MSEITDFKPCSCCKEDTHWKELSTREQWVRLRSLTFTIKEGVWDKYESLCHGCMWGYETKIPPNSVRFTRGQYS